MKKLVLTFLLFISTVSYAQWSPTSSYFVGQISGASSSPKAICLLTSSGVSMLKANNPKWSPLATMTGFSSPVIAGNDTIIVIAEGVSYNISYDGGASWTMRTGPGSPQFLGIMGHVIVAIDQANDLFFSTDYGLTWKQSPGFFVSSSGIIATVMYNEVYAIQYYGNGIEKLYKCSFDGVNFTSWQVVRSYSPYEYHNDLISYDSVLYMAASTGVKKSANKGVTWSFVGNAIGEASQICMDSSNIYAYYGMSGYGISSYSFKTNKWSTILPAYNDTVASLIAACEGWFYAGLSTYFGETMGFYRYLDGKWIPITALPVGAENLTIPCVRSVDNVLFSSILDVNGIQKGSAYISSDQGSTWLSCWSMESWSVNDAVHSGANYLIAGSLGVGIVNLTSNAITLAAGLFGYEAYSFEKFRNILYVGTADGIYTSTNDGANWTYKYMKGKIVYKLKVCRDTLFAGTDQGLFYSPNGITWGSTTCLVADIKDIAATTKDIFVTSVTGILKKIDSLNVWLPIGTSLVGIDVNALIARGARLYAGTGHGTVLYTDDGGGTWMDISDARFKNVTGIDISGNNLFVSENNLGVWIYPVDWPSGIDPGKGNSPLSLFPNPVKDHLTISIPDIFKVMSTIEIINIYGISLKSVRISEASDVKITINIDDLPNGIYLVILKNRNQRVCSRFSKVD